MKTVVFVDHPSFDLSAVNRRLVEELRKYPDEFLVHNLQSCYPRGSIDRVAEHSLIDNNGTLVLEFPLYWFSTPPLMKSWMDTVLEQGWAYGRAHHLEGHKVALAVTCGGSAADYSASGAHQHPLEDFLLPLIHSLEYCKAEYVGLFACYGALSSPERPLPAPALAEWAASYVGFLRERRMDAPAVGAPARR
ncbi:MAG: NAD(P)H-dependent oxidoreductase [Succinivibrionaceae bacterium]|nr:NAD(P)H-dependent oxidoreductase [Succinivibrionaceae bacterium]